MAGHLICERLTHSYGSVAALDEISFSCASGEIVALIGRTGCGKSSILRAVAGVLTPDSGTITIDGSPVATTAGLSAYMPQHDALLPWRSALDNAIFGAQLRGSDMATTRPRAETLFARFGLGGFERSWPHQLSGGMRQRVALLRTILVDARVLLLDEPFGSLDPITRLDLQGWFERLLADAPRTVVLVTHDVDEALRLADRVLVLSDRPARVIEALTVPAPRPRTLERRTEPDFATMKRQVLQRLGALTR